MPTPVRVEFDLKHFESITTSMLNYLASVQTFITDFNIGSVNRTLLEAVAMELEELYYRLYKSTEKAIPEAIYTAFDFTRLAATAAAGTVTFSRSVAAGQDYLIPQGTVVATADGVEFQTIADVTLVAGQTTRTASVVAGVTGAASNVAATSVTVLRTAILGIEAVTNAAAMTGGTDEESDDTRQIRFQEFIASLARSPIAGVEAGAKTVRLLDSAGGIVERVAVAKVVEEYLTDPSKPVGTATLYIDNGAGSASAPLIATCQQVIDGYTDTAGNAVIGYKAAGVVITVEAVTSVTQNVICVVTLLPNALLADVTAALKVAASGVFDGLSIGGSLDWEQLLATLIRVTGVKTLTLSTPSADVSCLSGQRIRLGTMTVS